VKIRLRYFARLREAFQTSGEEVVVPEEVCDITALCAWLRTRGGVWATELAPGRAYRVALDQQMVGGHTRLHEGAEVALFPPVTGG
jgi:molybdopterin synthase sulfur carrier subunit